MDERTFTLLYKSMVRPHVEFANSVCCPYKIVERGKAAAVASETVGGCRARRPVVDVSVASELAVL